MNKHIKLYQQFVFRYNGVHVAVKENQPIVCAEILSIIVNADFYISMFSDDPKSSVAQQRMNHLLDLYLNTPEKGLYETPLHIACKFGYTDVVRELLSYPICNKSATNKFGDTPNDIICSRSTNKSEKDKINQILQDQYFVPLLRFEDNSRQPIVGSPIVLNNQFNEDKISLAKNMEKCNLSNAGEVNNDVLCPDLTLSAWAGPMTKQQAEVLHKKWSTPRKSMKGNFKI